MAQISSTNTTNNDNDIQTDDYNIIVPKSLPRYSTQQDKINAGKCQLYQWLEVMGIPSPGNSKMYVDTIKKQYPSLGFNDNMYSNWLNEVVTVYRLKYNIDQQTNDNDNDNKNDNIEPIWLTLQDGNINNELLLKYNINKLSLQDRCLGCILSVFTADALGAPVEGWPYQSIIERYNSKGIINMIPGTHMGARNQGPRCGYYTDDTMTTMALALSIVTKQTLNAQHAAENYYKFWKTNPIYRGLPDTAQKVLNDVIKGISIKISGRQSFQDGSYANGGAMRISPVPLVYRNANCKTLKLAVIDAIQSSHVHKESIDGALIISLIIQYILKNNINNDNFNYNELINIITSNIETNEMKLIIKIICDGYNKFVIKYLDDINSNNKNILNNIIKYDIDFLKKHKLLTFQIRAIEAVPLVLYCFLRWKHNPQKCIINTVTLGGDCDTTGAMIGGIIGAMYGTTYIPKRWYYNLENTWKDDQNNNIIINNKTISIPTNAYGLDLALYLGLELSKLDFKKHNVFVEKNLKTSNTISSMIKNILKKH